MAFRLNRRAVIAGLGAGLALPVLECMLDNNGLLFDTAKAQSAAHPTRFLSFFFHNGVPQKHWAPFDNAGGGYDLNVGLKSLAPLKADFNQITGLQSKCLQSFFNHTDGQLGFLSGFAPHPDTKVGSAQTIEWILGNGLGKSTAFPALALSLPWYHSDRGDGNQNSWIGDSQRADVIHAPDVLASKLFGIKIDNTAQKRQQTILDFYKDEAKRLNAKLSAADKARLDQHLTSVQEIEQQLKASSGTCSPYAGGNIPAGNDPGDELAMQVMAKLIVYAFQCDLTRYVSLWVANVPPKVAGGSPMADHDASHDYNTDDNIYYIDKKMQYWKLILDGMKSSVEGDQSILYNSLSMTGSDVSWSKELDGHSFEDLPIILAGNAGGKIKTGRHLDYDNVTYNNLMLTIVNALGLNITKFGKDSTGILPNLMG